MRFFKYFIFVLFSFLSVNASAATEYQAVASGYPGIGYFPTQAEACSAWGAYYGLKPAIVYNGECYTERGFGLFQSRNAVEECPHPNTVTAVANVGAKLEAVRCVPLSGTNKFCVYKKSPNTLIINVPSSSNPEQGALAYDLVSQSKTPVDNCTPLFEGQCNPKDPYGGCFKVPDDGCTRTQNGSIVCPNNSVPPVENTCTGTYCKRPPTGCPSGYVSGSFNGEALCVKSSPSSGGGSGDGSGSGNGDGSGTGSGNGSGNGDGSGTGSGNGSGTGSGSNSSTSSSTSTSTSTSTSSNGSGGSTTVNVTNNNTNNTTVNVDVSGVISAINNMKSTLADFLNDVNKSVKEVTTTLNGTNQKIDATNTKLDSVNTTLNSINQNGKDTNAKLDQLIAKNGNGDGTGTDLTATNEKLDKINDKLQKTNDFLTGEPPTDENTSIPTRELTEQNFATNLITVNAAYCPSDKHIDWSTPFGHFNKSISYQPVCDQTAWFGYLVLCFCYYAAAMIVVRA